MKLVVHCLKCGDGPREGQICLLVKFFESFLKPCGLSRLQIQLESKPRACKKQSYM